MSLMTSPGMRDAAGAAGRGRGTVAGMLLVTASGFAATGAPLNIGAGCEPDCMNSTLIRIASVAEAPTRKPTASRGLHPSRRNRRGPRSSAIGALLPRPARAAGLRTFPHRRAVRLLRVAAREPLDHRPRLPGARRSPAVYRQAERDA